MTVEENGAASADALFAGPGEVCARARALDWAATPLGPVEGWPAALRAVVRTCMESPFPVNLWCGPELVLVYNDAYRRVLGARHPRALGRPGLEVWADIRADVEPMFARIRAGGPPVYAEDAQFVLSRADDAGEEAYFTFGLSAVRDEDGTIVAFFNPAAETTARVLAERRLADANRALEVERERLAAVFEQSPSFLAVLRGADGVFELVNDAYARLVGRPRAQLLGRPLLEALPEARGQRFDESLGRVRETGTPLVLRDLPALLQRTPGAPLEERFIDITFLPLAEPDGSHDAVIAHGTDVTEEVRARREAERLLAEAEAARRRLTDTFESITDPFFIVDRDWRFTYVNPAAERVVGRPRAQLLGTGLWEEFPEAVGTPYYENAHVAVRERRAVDFEAYYPPPLDLWTAMRIYPLGTADAPEGIAVYYQDVTARVRAEAERERLLQALRVERERLAYVFQHAPTFLAVVRGPTHVFELVNDAYYGLVGHRPLLGRPVLEALPEVRAQGFVDLLDTVLATGEPFVGRELPVRLARTPESAPEERFVDFVYLPLVEADGACSGVIAHGSDVTAQVQARRETERLLRESEAAQAALAASEARLRDVFEQAPVAVAVLAGPEHVYTVMSPRYAAYLPAGRGALGRPLREAVPDIVGQGVAELMDLVYETGDPYFAHERLVRLDRDHDGVPEDYYFDIGYQPLRDASGAVYAIASVTQDVTAHVLARREAEAARQAAEVARAAAEEANRAKSQFLSTMSHELRTPLNAIQGYTELLALGLRGPLTEPQRQDLDRVRRANRHLTGLVTDILNFARLEAGQVEFHVVDLELGAVVGDLEPLVGPQLAARGLTFSHDACASDTPDRPHVVRADPEKLRQVLLNLLTNAIKFTDAGGHVALACESDAAAGVVRVRVSDTGRGIPAGQLERIFEPFVQVDRHRTDASQQGVGLGLAISRDLARGMGGELTAESEEGRGSTFTVTLPRVPPTDAGGEAA